MTTDENLGLERLQVAVAKKQTLPALKCQMQRAEIILHVERVLLKHVSSIFSQGFYHRFWGKSRCIFYRLQRLHTQLVMLNIVFIVKHRFLKESQLNAFVIRHIDRPLNYRNFATSFDKISFCGECNNLVCARNKFQARQFGGAKFVSSCKHCKIHVRAVRIQTKYQQEGIAKIKSMLFQAIAIFQLYVEKI